MKKFFHFWNKKLFRQISYFVFIISAVLLLGYLGSNNRFIDLNKILETYELKTYDLRLQMADKAKDTNKNIVIVSIDNESLDVLQDDFGRWPWTRDVYTNIVNYLVKKNVDLVDFDMMFVGYQKGFKDKDIEFAKTVAKSKNVFVSMSFDYIDEVKNTPELPAYLKVNLENHSKIAFDIPAVNDFNYCNLILDRMINNTKNVGIINFMRDDDNVSRRSSPFFKYKGGYYPYMSLKLASDYISRHENVKIDKYIIDNKRQLLFANRKIQLDNNGAMIINWYGKNYQFTTIPFWKVYKSIENEQKGLSPISPLTKDFFKNKVVFIGATANSLYDIKSTPLNPIYPGVKVLATVFDNILDKNTIKRVSELTNFGICLLLGLLIGIAVIKISEPLISTLISIIILASYIFFATYMLNNHNLWFDILPQIAFVIMTFTFMFIVKYVLKSKDFEYTYKLATTDGLTNLYNHRYFQEHLTKCMQKCDKTGERFSLILIDIDHFKKFNDTYGHQAGDEVLRQVGQTLRKAVKSHDLVARYGGEEMVIVLNKAHSEAALKIANRICKTVADRPFQLSEGLTVNVTISLGVATYPIDGKTSTELIEFADQGLYRAKENGRNQVGALPEIKIITAEN